MRLRNWLAGHWRETARAFAFEEYDAPVVESRALYERKSGPEIVDQLYAFADRSGRPLALRPEMTPSLARIVLARRATLTLPLKWWSAPQCWRYERMARGRRREHHQWNMDVWGVGGAAAEAELLASVTHLLGRVGLRADDVRVRLSCRRFFGAALAALGVPDRLVVPVAREIDALGKRGADATRAALAEVLLAGPGAGEDAGAGLQPAPALDADGAAVLADAVVSVSALRADATPGGLQGLADAVRAHSAAVGASASTHGTCAAAFDSDATSALQELVELAPAYGLTPWLELDLSIVRGLQYYTGVVFEAFDRGGQLRALCGGGRYDRLLSTIRGSGDTSDDIPAAGFGFGDAVLMELLEERRLLPADAELRAGVAPDVVLFPWGGGELRTDALALATELRSWGLAVDLVLDNRRAKWAFRLADRRAAAHVVMLAPGEWERGEVLVKSMRGGEQRAVPVGDLQRTLLAPAV
eukprot:g3868.t1